MPNETQGENGFIIRNATVEDIPFIVEAIINAEKSNSDILMYTTVFGLTEEETRLKLTEILEEETDGCELSLSSYMVVEKDGKLCAAQGAWIEGWNGISSAALKQNLIICYFPKECFTKAIAAASVVDDLATPSTPGTLQLGCLYVEPAYRKFNLVDMLENKLAERALLLKNDLSEMEGYILGSNLQSMLVHKMLGWDFVLKKETKDAKGIFPSNVKWFIRKKI
jgi:hypothetical protein